MHKNSALLLIDLQQDFCAHGSLAVPDADSIIARINQIQELFPLVIATQDWHPLHHVSFASTHNKKPGEIIKVANDLTQVLWPDHCVQGSAGAQLHAQLNTSKIKKIIYKGQQRDVDSYSAFFDNAQAAHTDLAQYLQHHAIQDLYCCGLATDYCVQYSCADAVHLGFKVHLVLDCCRGVAPATVNHALHALQGLGVKIMYSNNF